MRRGAWHVLMGTAAAVVVMAGLRAAASILIPLVVASLLALIMLPVVTRLRVRGVPAGLAVVGSMLVALLALAGPAGIIAAAARRFVERAPDYRAALGQRSAAMSNWLESHGIPPISTVADPGILLDQFLWIKTLVSAATGSSRVSGPPHSASSSRCCEGWRPFSSTTSPTWGR